MAKVMKSEGDGKHPSSHYLVVEDPQKPTTWHLRVRNVSGDIDPRLLGAAWAALHGGYRGNKYQGPNKEQALSKLKKLYAQAGKTPPSTGNKAVFYRSGDDLWFFGIYSNNFEDRQSDIITEEAHEEYVEWLRTTGIKPPITIMHQPHYPEVVHAVNYMGLVYGKYSAEKYSENLEKLYKPFAIAKTEKVLFLNGFAFVIGRVYEHKRKAVERLIEQSNQWGMSHGFIPVKTDGNIINKYRTFEFTVAPQEYVVNRGTTVGFILKENLNTMGESIAKSLSEDQKQELNELLNGKAEDLEEATEKMKEIMSDVLISKAEDVPEEEDDQEDTEDEKEVVEVKAIFDEQVIEQLTTTFKTIEEVMGGMKAEITSLKTEIAQLKAGAKKTEDDIVAEHLTFPDWKVMFNGLSVEKQEENPEIVEKLKEGIPDQIVQDKTIDRENPLQGLFWEMFPQS